MVQKARFTSALLNRTAPVSIFTPAGLYLGQRMMFDVDLSRLDRVVARITKGLFYSQQGYALPPQYVVSVYSDAGLRGLSLSEVREIQNTVIAPTLKTPVHSIGRGVMRYWVAWDHKPPVSCWIYEFYSDVRFAAIIIPRQSE